MKQVSVFVENRPGRLQAMLAALAARNVNIRALSIADTSDFGVVRMILSDTDAGLEAVRGAGFTAGTTTVLRAEMPDQPGGLLHSIVAPLAEGGVNIEYVYAFVDQPLEKAVVVLKVSDLDKAEEILRR